MKRIIKSIFVLFLLGFFTGTSAQLPPKVIADKYLTLASGKLDSIETSLDSIKTSVEELKGRLEATKIIRLGLSVGPRFTRVKGKEGASFVDPSISLKDSTLQLDDRDKSDFVLSAILTITPGIHLKKPTEADRRQRFFYWLFSRSTFLINLNLINITNGGKGAEFNEKIEGGLGYGISLHKNFVIGVTYERIFNRALRQNITDMQGNVIMVGGQPVTELNPDSEILFRDDNLTAYSFKFIFFY